MPCSPRSWLFLTLAWLLLLAPAPAWPQASSPPGQRERSTWYLLGGSDAEGLQAGAAKPLSVRLRPVQGMGSVGFMDAGVGESAMYYSRAAGWQAVTVAALLSGQPFLGWEVVFSNLLDKNKGDGPSHGAVMTVAVLAAILDHPILPHVTMTGAINPDGSIGPVGSLPQKIFGARQAGLTKVLFPAGERMYEPQGGGLKIDLVEHGRKLGVEAVEVADIYQAYRHFTGRELPLSPPPGGGGRAIAAPAAMLASAAASCQRWEAVFQDRVALITRLAASLPQLEQDKVARLWREAHAARNHARHLAGQGDQMAAWAFFFRASQLAELAALRGQMLIAAYAQGLGGIKQTLRGYLMGAEEMDGLTRKLNLPQARNLNDYLTLSGIFAFSTLARGANARAQWVLAQMDEEVDTDKAMQVAGVAAGLAVQARSLMNLLPELARLGLGLPGPPVPHTERVLPWARTLERAMDGNHAMIEAHILNREDQRLGMHVPEEMTKRRMLWRNPYYQLLEGCRPFAQAYLDEFLGKRQVREQDQLGVAPLGSQGLAWVLSSLVWSKEYALPRRKETMEGVGRQVDPERLAQMLELGRGGLREAILAAQAQGWTPALPLMHLQVAQAAGGPQQQQDLQVASLADYWMGTLLARLGLALSAP